MLINQGGATAEEAEIQAEAYREAHGLNDPLPVQYLNWMRHHPEFDFGHSLYYNKPSATWSPSVCRVRFLSR